MEHMGMSSFNMVAGYNKLAPMVLHALNLEHGQIPRFRDAYLDLDEPARPKLVILTRTGGGNRAGYVDENKTLSGLVGFISDHDDKFDTTFAHWQFEVPSNVDQEIKDLIAQIIKLAADPKSPLDPEVLMKPMDRFRSRMDGGWADGPEGQKAADQLRETFRRAGLSGEQE
jgi:hypothetical protein